MSNSKVTNLSMDELDAVSAGYGSITQQIQRADQYLKSGNSQAYFTTLRRTVDTLNSAMPEFNVGVKWPVNGPDPSPIA